MPQYILREFKVVLVVDVDDNDDNDNDAVDCDTDLEFVKKFTRPNFRAKEFYTLKTRKSRLFLPAINSKNASLSVIWPSFG